MNKDVKGLIVYLSLIIFVMLLPLIYFIALTVVPVKPEYDEFGETIFILIAIIFLFLYFLIPLITTHYAIKKHWSIYLDRFFNQWLLSSLVLVILLLPMAPGIKIPDDVSEELFKFLSMSYISVAPCYCLIYLVIFWHNFFRLVKNLLSFICKKL